MAVIREITDLQMPEMAVFARLTEAQLRNRLEPEQGVFIAESAKVIALALQAGCQPLALLMERRLLRGQGAAIMAQCGDIPVYTGDRAVLADLTGYRLTRGILCAMRRPKLPRAAKVCCQARRVAVLEELSDGANVGAVFRSAAALGIDGVLVRPSCCDPLCRHAVRVSMGTVFQIPWAWLETEIPSLRDFGFKIAAFVLAADAVSIEEPQLAAEDKLALVFGSEGYGLPATVIDACDYAVQIPMSPQVDSLNVAAASAVAFWQLRCRT